MTSSNDSFPFPILASAISFVLFSVFTYVSGFSVGRFVLFTNELFHLALVQTTGMSTIQSLFAVMVSFGFLIIALCFLVLGFSFLCVHGRLYESDWRVLIAGGVGAGSFLLLHLSVFSIFIATAFLLCTLYILPLSATYAQELQRWTRFRIGSHAVGKILMIINVFVAVGIFVAVLLAQQTYAEIFVSDTTDVLTTIALGSTSALPEELGATLSSQIGTLISESSFFQGYIRWLPVTTAIGIWVVLEVLRTLVFSHLAGVFTALLIRND